MWTWLEQMPLAAVGGALLIAAFCLAGVTALFEKHRERQRQQDAIDRLRRRLAGDEE